MRHVTWGDAAKLEDATCHKTSNVLDDSIRAKSQ